VSESVSSGAAESGLKHPSRAVVVPDRFASVQHYCAVWERALVEEMNLSLLEQAERFWGVYGRITAPTRAAAAQGAAAAGRSGRGAGRPGGGSGPLAALKAPSCKHGAGKLCVVRKEGPNHGRFFYGCSAPRDLSQPCKLFQWVDIPVGDKAAGQLAAAGKGGGGAGAPTGCAVVVREPGERQQVFRAAGLAYYSALELFGAQPAGAGGRRGAGGAGGGEDGGEDGGASRGKRQRTGGGGGEEEEEEEEEGEEGGFPPEPEPAKIYIKIPRGDGAGGYGAREASGAYSAGDLWVLSDKVRVQ
jgi:hypothetical protein